MRVRRIVSNIAIDNNITISKLYSYDRSTMYISIIAISIIVGVGNIAISRLYNYR